MKLGDFPAEITRRLPRYPLVPAILLGLLADALFPAVRSEIASFAVIVDAKDDTARRFYERESFLPLPDQPRKLFRSIADIRQLFALEHL